MSPEMAAAIADASATLVRVVPVPVAQGWGVDLDCVSDITPGADDLANNSQRALAQAIIHVLSTEPDGSVVRLDDPNYGFNVLRLLHKATDPAALTHGSTRINAAITHALDDRIALVDVTLAANLTTKPVSLSVKLVVTPRDPSVGVFKLTLAVTDAGVLMDALEVGTA